jgi:hypothetical protein
VGDEANLAAADETIMIPGHGPVGNRSELKDYRDMLIAVRESLLALKTQGQSLNEIVAAKPTAYGAKWGQFAVGPRLVHQTGLRRRLIGTGRAGG